MQVRMTDFSALRLFAPSSSPKSILSHYATVKYMRSARHSHYEPVVLLLLIPSLALPRTP